METDSWPIISTMNDARKVSCKEVIPHTTDQMHSKMIWSLCQSNAWESSVRLQCNLTKVRRKCQERGERKTKSMRNDKRKYRINVLEKPQHRKSSPRNVWFMLYNGKWVCKPNLTTWGLLTDIIMFVGGVELILKLCVLIFNLHPLNVLYDCAFRHFGFWKC